MVWVAFGLYLLAQSLDMLLDIQVSTRRCVISPSVKVALHVNTELLDQGSPSLGCFGVMLTPMHGHGPGGGLEEETFATQCTRVNVHLSGA